MQQAGYSRINKEGEELQYFDDVKGMISLPDGSQIHGAELGYVFSDGSKIVERWVDDPMPIWHERTGSTITFDGDKVVITYVYEETPSLVPREVTPLQIRKALRKEGLRDQIEAYINTLSDDNKDEWNFASRIERNNPTFTAGAEILGFTEQQIDDLFRLAYSIND